MTLGITSWNYDIDLWNLYVTDCNHILIQTVKSYHHPHAVALLCNLLWDIHAVQNEAFEMLVCRWVRKFLQLFILKHLVVAVQVIFCAGRSTDSQYFWPSPVSCSVVIAEFASLCFQYVPKKSSIQYDTIVGWRCTRDRNPLPNFQHNGETVLYKWITVFKNSHTSVTGEEWSGYQSTTIRGENIEWVHFMILGNLRLTVDEVVHYLYISHGYALGMNQDWLKFHKVLQDGS
jgi:hypothetical protein